MKPSNGFSICRARTTRRSPNSCGAIQRGWYSTAFSMRDFIRIVFLNMARSCHLRWMTSGNTKSRAPIACASLTLKAAAGGARSDPGKAWRRFVKKELKDDEFYCSRSQSLRNVQPQSRSADELGVKGKTRTPKTRQYSGLNGTAQPDFDWLRSFVPRELALPRLRVTMGRTVRR